MMYKVTRTFDVIGEIEVVGIGQFELHLDCVGGDYTFNYIVYRSFSEKAYACICLELMFNDTGESQKECIENVKNTCKIAINDVMKQDADKILSQVVGVGFSAELWELYHEFKLVLAMEKHKELKEAL